MNDKDKTKIINTFCNLFKIKSIVTLVCMLVFAKMAISNQISETEVMIIITSCVTYFFNRDVKDNKNE